eukprot:TRINITY_DN11441_c0_g2_i1.p1 TRINITY_DN11441_c0_g2~~TRINITY_DN11441_c0_g2_i1.p1  ORF type:complete len:204 (+),score=44.31 TRINITY_DN11441_c0_g2_i1:44-613(+)
MALLGYPREALLKHYYRGSGTHMELLSQADVKITACANTAGTDWFKNDPFCHTMAEIEQIKNSPQRFDGNPVELSQIARSPPEDKMVNIHNGRKEEGWTQITESNVDSVKSSLESASQEVRSSRIRFVNYGFVKPSSEPAKEKARLARMKLFQKTLLVLKFTCERPWEPDDPTALGQFKFKKIAIYFTK